MLKRVSAILYALVGVLVLAAAVSACQPKTAGLAQASPSPAATALPATPTSLPTATATIAPTATPTQPKAQPTPTTEPTAGQEKPAPTPTTPWQIPEEREDDWVKGGQNAGLIMVEYGDYQ